jgi:hypothetical protein
MEPARLSAEDFVFNQKLQPLSFATTTTSNKNKRSNMSSSQNTAKKRFKGISGNNAGHQLVVAASSSRARSATPGPNDDSSSQQQLVQKVDTTNLPLLLKKHVVCIDTTLWNQATLQQIAEGMGALVKPKLDNSVGVYIIEPKENERLSKLASKASTNGIKCVSPNWIMTCYNEKKYHPPVNFPYDVGKALVLSCQNNKLQAEAPALVSRRAEDSALITTTNDYDNPFGDEELDFDYLEANQPGMQRKLDEFVTRSITPLAAPSLLTDSASASQCQSAHSTVEGEPQRMNSNTSSYPALSQLAMEDQAYQVELDEDDSQARKEFFYNNKKPPGNDYRYNNNSAKRKEKEAESPEEKELKEKRSKERYDEAQELIRQIKEKEEAEATATATATAGRSTRSHNQQQKQKIKEESDNGKNKQSFGDGRLKVWYGNTTLDISEPLLQAPTSSTTRKTSTSNPSLLKAQRRAR